MTRGGFLSVLCAVMVAGQAVAFAPEDSLRPKARPGGLVAGASAPSAGPNAARGTGFLDQVRRVLNVDAPRTPRPKARTVAAPKPDAVVLVTNAAGVQQSLRPKVRPRDLKARTQQLAAAKVRRSPAPVISRKVGKICGDRKIQGVKVPRVIGKIRGCGVADPVKVSVIEGVVLSQSAIMDCNTARALQTWIKKGAKPAVGRLGGGIKSLRVVAHYSCRTRNSRKGAKISEHGKGKAIDIAAIKLQNDVQITVLKGWKQKRHGKILRAMHKAACGPFGTVLGPDSDRYHQDHFHFDTARHRGGAYCR